MERILSYPEAIREALEQEMSEDDRVIVMGQGVDDPKAILGPPGVLLRDSVLKGSLTPHCRKMG